MGYIEGASRGQVVLFPESLEDYVREDNPVRFLDAFVNELDVGELGFEHGEIKETGRPPYHPGDLLKLYLYGYLNGIRSSRRLERECGRNVELLWLLGRLKPDFKTIADFRKNNGEALRRVTREFTLLCRRLDLFGGQLVAIDGSVFRAVNSKDRNYSNGKLVRLMEQVDRRIESYLADMEAADREEGHSGTQSASDLAAKIRLLKERKARYGTLLNELAGSNVTQISLTDPDARQMRGRKIGYNVQTAVDSKHKLIVAADVTNEENDTHQLAHMAQAAKEALGVEELTVVADKGYHDGHELRECMENGITPFVSKPQTSTCKKHGRFSKEDFRYNEEHDCYICPEGAVLRLRTRNPANEQKAYKTNQCNGCQVRSDCTTNKNGRVIYRWIDERVLEETEHRVGTARGIMAQRKELAEHPFGTLKRSMNHGYFLTKGMEKVRTEFSLSVLAYNLKRVINLLGVNRLLEMAA